MGKDYDILLPLAGSFQASNALLAAGLAIAAGIAVDTAIAALAGLEGAPGRLERVAETPNGAAIFIDYAHKPDALRAVLAALRPMTRGRLVVVFGAGGDRDAGKRPLMGEAAAQGADIVVVTDDNPRSEDPAAIRAAILAGAPQAVEIAGREAAIRAAIAMLQPGDVLCIAGKGHETGQIVGRETLPFSDHAVVAATLAEAA
jgi:UDP-N-acetylmuramoyl-L-alanyl-D-glutamate--2,6-diaminopimelate ligase